MERFRHKVEHIPDQQSLTDILGLLPILNRKQPFETVLHVHFLCKYLCDSSPKRIASIHTMCEVVISGNLKQVFLNLSIDHTSG